jgi:hypothetical protein
VPHDELVAAVAQAFSQEHYRARTGVTASALAPVALYGALTFPERFAAEQALTRRWCRRQPQSTPQREAIEEIRDRGAEPQAG